MKSLMWYLGQNFRTNIKIPAVTNSMKFYPLSKKICLLRSRKGRMDYVLRRKK